MRHFGFGLVLMGAGLCAATVFAHTQQTAPENSNVAIMDGATLFRERGCAQCHQVRGVGGHKGPDLSGVGRRLKPDAIKKQIEQGGAAMPAFGEVLPQTEIDALVKYLQKRRDKAPRSKKNLPQNGG